MKRLPKNKTEVSAVHRIRLKMICLLLFTSIASSSSSSSSSSSISESESSLDSEELFDICKNCVKHKWYFMSHSHHFSVDNTSPFSFVSSFVLDCLILSFSLAHSVETKITNYCQKLILLMSTLATVSTYPIRVRSRCRQLTFALFCCFVAAIAHWFLLFLGQRQKLLRKFEKKYIS